MKLILSNIRLIPPNLVELTFMTPENIIISNTKPNKEKGEGIEKLMGIFLSQMEKSQKMMEIYPDTILRMRIDEFLKSGHKIGDEVVINI